MRRALPAVFALLAYASPVMADEPFPATLEGHVVIPAETFIDAPADAPADLKTPGKFTSGRRVDAPWLGGRQIVRPSDRCEISVPRPAGARPFRRQADGGRRLLGHYRQRLRHKSEFADNSMLYLNQYRFDWNDGTAERLATIFLHDPDRKAPFRIANEATDKRYLTGADFDTESFQPIRGENLDRRRIRAVSASRRPQRQGRSRVLDDGRRQARALPRPLHGDLHGDPERDRLLQRSSFQGL